MEKTKGTPAVMPGPRTALGQVLVRNVVFNVSGQLLLTTLAFFATPYLIRHLGSARYGILMLLLAVVDVLALFQIGINTGLVKYVAEVFGQEKQQEACDYVRTALSVLLAIGAAVAGTIAILTHWFIVSVFRVPADLEQAAIYSFYLASAAFLVRFVTEAFSAVPIAAQRFDLVNYVFVGSECFRLFGSILVVYLGHGLEGVAAIILLANLLFLIANIFLARRLLPALVLQPRFRKQHFQRLFHFSKFVAVSSLTSRVGNNLAGIVIAHFLPVAHVAFYTVPYGLCQRLWVLVGNVTTVVFPAASALSGAKDVTRLRELYLRSSKLIAALVAFPSLALCLLSREVLLFWIGPEFAAQGALPLRLLSLVLLVNSLMYVPAGISQAMGRPQIQAKFNVLQLVLNLLSFIALVPRLGILGAAIGSLGTQLVLAPWFIRTTNELVGVRWRDLCVKAYAQLLIPLAASGLILAVWSSHIHSLSSLVLGGIASFLVYLALGVFLVLDPKERGPLVALWTGQSLPVWPSKEA